MSLVSNATAAGIFVGSIVFGVALAPNIVTGPPPPPSIFCDEMVGAPAQLDGKPAIVFQLCDSPYRIVVPGVARIDPSAINPADPDDPQFYDSPTVRMPPATEEVP